MDEPALWPRDWQWVKKAFESVLLIRQQKKVVCFCQREQHTLVSTLQKGTLNLLKGRLKFGDCKNPAPFPNMVVIFGV